MPKPSPTVPRETVVTIADNFCQLMDLKQRQAVTQAKLIRWCVRVIRKRHQPVPFPDHRNRVKLTNDRDLALLHLEWLATQLENQSTEGDPPCTQV